MSDISSDQFEVGPSDPFSGAIARWKWKNGDVVAVEKLLASWRKVQRGSFSGRMRYPWQLTHYHIDLPEFAPDTAAWRPWRLGDAKLNLEPSDFEERFLSIIAITESVEALLEWSASPSSPLAKESQTLFSELEPIVRWDLARHVQSMSAWHDSFALWNLVTHPLLLEKLQTLAFAISIGLSASARKHEGRLVGERFPFYEQPLVSASAQLGKGLLLLGIDLDLAAQLVSFVRDSKNEDGSWQDADGPPDIMTTLVAADLLSCIDPGFEPALTKGFFESKKTSKGSWIAFGPESPWISRVILEWRTALEKPFAVRFKWPQTGPSTKDHKTGIPNFGWFEQIADMMDRLQCLSSQPIDMAFVDLAGFKKLNNQFGQEMGDSVLKEFAKHANGCLAESRMLRDGGDEFVILGPPTGTKMGSELEAVGQNWPKVFQRIFGNDVPMTSPRIVFTSTFGRELKNARRKLGIAIGKFKAEAPLPPAEGAIKKI